MSTRRAIVVIAIMTAFCAAVLLVAGDRLVWLRTIVGVPFALLLPGQATMLCVDPDRRLGGYEWFTLSIAASIALVTVLAVGLASTVGLVSSALVGAIAIVTLVILAVAVVPAMSLPAPRGGASRRSPLRRAAYAAATLLACAALVTLASLPVLGQVRSSQVVQLWALPDKGGDGLRIGAVNVDATSRKYQLSIGQSGRPIADMNVDMPAGTRRIFLVKRSALWSENAPVSAILTDASSTIAPRSVSVWPTQ